MNYCIVSSQVDLVSGNIGAKVREVFNFVAEKKTVLGDLYHDPDYDVFYLDTPLDSLYLENIGDSVPADNYVFLYCHESKTGDKILSVHANGNWSAPVYGGRGRKLSPVSSRAMKMMMLELERSRISHSLHDYTVVQEATHHGPYVKRNSFFVEIGSELCSWSNELATRTAASAIKSFIEKYSFGHFGDISTYNSVAVVGGPHIDPRISTLMLRSNYAVGHICSSRNLGDFDAESLSDVLLSSVDDVDGAVKGVDLVAITSLGKEKGRIKFLLEQKGLRQIRLGELLKSIEPQSAELLQTVKLEPVELKLQSADGGVDVRSVVELAQCYHSIAQDFYEFARRKKCL